MEVSSSSAMTSTPQDASSHMLQYTATATSTSAGPVVSTSSAESDGLNNIASSDCVGNIEVPVRYGPALPPSFYPSEITYSKDVQDPKAVHGSCGLYNLGNTCFMNAGLQSLMSCAPLVKFFCEKYMVTDANKNTLTGHFYMLLCKIWSGQFSVVHPRRFKDFLGFYHSQFEDYRQHDCQEFLALLLDTLHEQLNNATAANKHSYSSPPLLVAASSSSCIPLPFPERSDLRAITTAAAGGESLFVSDEERIRDEPDNNGSDLNNKDSNVAVINHDVEAKDEESECRKSPAFLGVNQVLSGSEAAGQSPSYPNEGSPTSEVSVLDSIATSPSSHGECTSHKSPEHGEEDEIISSSVSPLRRYISRSNLDDVSSSDSNIVTKPSLKRVSSGSSVTACGPSFHSEDSNHSSVSAHSTDSEQSSAFKRLKIDAVELNRNANNNVKDCVTSSSDCRKSNRSRKNMLGENAVLKEAANPLTTSSVPIASSHKDINVIDNMVSSCQDSLCIDEPLDTCQDKSSDDHQSPPSPTLPCLDDFYSKETKTLNTNVLVSDFLQDITSDSEKFAKVDNRNRPPSKEINLLQEAFGEEDKAEKILIGHRFGGLKDTNLYAQSAVTVVKPVKNADPNVLNNTLNRDVIPVEAISKCVPHSAEVIVEENTLPLKLLTDSPKLDEEEKNVQMQAYTKFNTIPERSNIRTDLIDPVADPDSMEVDEAEVETSDDDEVEMASRTSTVEECSSVPNCLRHCAPSEVMMASRAWEEYQSKNDSVVVSTFQGQFRSTVVCSECSHVSVTYEPFMYLSLPIPHAMDQQISVVYISQHKPPVRYLLNLLKTDKIGTAKKKLCELIGQEDGDIIMAEVLDSHISRILDDNVLLKYVNTFNRKIYGFEIVSSEAGNIQIADSVSCDQMMNNEESPSFQHDFELPSSSRAELPYVTDSQVSSQSFDSINVNSPSSRDTLDCMFSDSETCEPSSREHPDFSSSYFTAEDEEAGGECQSTSGKVQEKGPWVCGDYSSNHCLSWSIDDDDDDDDGNASVSTNTTAVASSSSPTAGEDNVNSCTSGFWLEKSDNDHDGSAVSNSGDETIVNDNSTTNEASSSEVVCDSEAKPSQGKHILLVTGSPAKTEEEDETVTSKSEGAGRCSSFTTTASVTTITVSSNNVHYYQQHISSSTDINSHGGSSKNPSRSCPSPETFSHPSEHEATLLGVAARLEESPGSYFLHRSQEDGNFGFYEDEGTNDVTNTSCHLSDEKGRNQCEDSNWSSFPIHSTSSTETQTIRPMTDQWRSCAICLEDLLDTELLTHIMCDGVFCQNCLEMSVKHTADVSSFCCPICLQPANMCEDFVPLASTTASKPKIRTLPMSIAYRHNVTDNTGLDSLQLFGHPNILHMPSMVTGDTLYTLVDRMVSPLLTTYSVMLTDGQGLTCSRCAYSRHCTGCEIAREGEITLQPSDCLTVHVCDTLSLDQVGDMQFVHEDSTMAGLRSSEPTTIMDCFGAFTQSEILDEHNPWYCPQCKRNQCAKKTMTVWRYPDNLIIHLKRFVYQDLSSTKVDTKVIFPQEGMDVRGFLSGPASSGLVYDLYSIVCHFGGASAGHYTCYAKHPLTQQWYYYNDESVSQQSPSESEYNSGYVLFYQRQGIEVDFTPPVSLPCFDDDHGETGVAPSSSSAAYVNRNSSITNGAEGNNSMAVVLFQPLTISHQEPTDKAEEEDDDYDNEKRCSPCDDESLTVHFGSAFTDHHDSFGDENDENSNGEDGRTHIAEPDSTLEFYS